jgi:3'-phosphoadenosine 5'-phosphosulfate sulfotransferase (PAPS reductase)/FAD synthetase
MSNKHVVSVSSGKDSVATLLIALERCPKGSVIPLFLDTDNESQEVYDHLDYLEQALDITIVRRKADFTEQLLAKRKFIANDQRMRREYDTAPKTDKAGNIVYRKTNDGEIELRGVWSRKAGKDVFDLEGVPKMVKVNGRKVRWSNKAKRRALAVLRPSGNAFLDLCMWKGRFPSRKAQFCTQELKTAMAVEFQLELMDQGYKVISWQGIRRNESHNRRNARLWERVGPALRIFRPIVEWTAQQVFEYAASKGIRPNPLYLMGMSRVGCFCINSSKSELRQWAIRLPQHPARIGDWEWIVGQCSKRGFSTWFSDASAAVAAQPDRRVIFAELNIWSRIEWSKTTRGGQQFDLLADQEESGCSSSYGLCDVGDLEMA